jgi:ACDE family multidrug resistance protein
MRIHRPVALLQLDATAGSQLARLSGLEGFSRSILVGVAPLMALDTMGSKTSVSIAYAIAAVLALSVTLNIGRLEEFFARRWIVTGGVSCLVVAAALLMTESRVTFVLGITFIAIAASVFSVTVSLYVMDFIGKAELTKTESKRMVFNGGAWFIGPSLGIFLWINVHRLAPFLLSAAFGLLTLWLYWRLRLGPNPVVVAPKSKMPSPLKNIPRFFHQRFLRVAYAITMIRAMFWVSLFVYSPIYVVDAGLDEWVAGALLSGVAGILLFSPFVHVWAQKFGARFLIVRAFVLTGAGLVGLAALGDPRPIGLFFWVVASLGAACIDVLGNIPFMRTVKPRERTAMTSVFASWRDVSALAAPLAAAGVLLVLPFWAYYLVIATLCFAAAAYATNLPRRI